MKGPRTHGPHCSLGSLHVVDGVWHASTTIHPARVDVSASMRTPPKAVPVSFFRDISWHHTCPPSASSSRQHGAQEGLQTPLKQLVTNAHSARVLRRRQGVLDDILDIQVRPDLVQVLAQIGHLGVGQHDELHARRRLVVVQLVFSRAVGQEGVVGAAQLGHHVAQREDQTEDQFLVVCVREAPVPRWGRDGAVIGATGGRSQRGAGCWPCGLARCRRRCARGGDGAWSPAPAVYALRCVVSALASWMRRRALTMPVEYVEAVENHVGGLWRRAVSGGVGEGAGTCARNRGVAQGSSSTDRSSAFCCGLVRAAITAAARAHGVHCTTDSRAGRHSCGGLQLRANGRLR